MSNLLRPVAEFVAGSLGLVVEQDTKSRIADASEYTRLTALSSQDGLSLDTSDPPAGMGFGHESLVIHGPGFDVKIEVFKNGSYPKPDDASRLHKLRAIGAALSQL